VTVINTAEKNTRKLHDSVFDIQHSTFAVKINTLLLVKDPKDFRGEPSSSTKLEKNLKWTLSHICYF